MSEPQGPDSAAHLDLEAISDLDEGLLAPADAEAAREHLAGCSRCQDDQAALAAVREALAGDREIAMPEDVAEGIFGALAALTPLTADDVADAALGAPAGAAVTTLPAPRAPSRWQRAQKPLLVGLGAAAGIALIVLGVIHLPKSTGSSATSSGSAATTTAALPVSHSGRNYDSAGLGTEALSLLPGGATSAAAAATSGAAAAATSAAAAAPLTAAGTSAAASSAAAATTAAAGSGETQAGPARASAATATSTEARTPQAGTTSVAAAPTTDVLAALRADGAAQACLMSFEPRSGTPLAIDFATFNGKPAVIGVFSDPDNSARLQVVAVGPPGCSLYGFAHAPKP